MLLIETTLKEFPNKGIGLVSVNFIPKGTIVYRNDYIFDILIPRKKVLAMGKVQQDFFEHYCSFSNKHDSYYVCVDNARFLNHSQSPNLKYLKRTKEYITKRAIEAGEELTCNYLEFDDLSKDGDLGFTIY